MKTRGTRKPFGQWQWRKEIARGCPGTRDGIGDLKGSCCRGHRRARQTWASRGVKCGNFGRDQRRGPGVQRTEGSSGGREGAARDVGRNQTNGHKGESPEEGRPWKTVWHVLKQSNMQLPYEPAIPRLSVYPRILKAGTQTYGHSHVQSSITRNSQKVETTQGSIS